MPMSPRCAGPAAGRRAAGRRCQPAVGRDWHLTQSTRPHSALYVGDARALRRQGRAAAPDRGQSRRGLRRGALSRYEFYNTRICRPRHLTPEDTGAVVDFRIQSPGLRYDMKNILDLLRYFLPQPPIPRAGGARCWPSARATRPGDLLDADRRGFRAIRYPILPRITREFRADTTKCARATPRNPSISGTIRSMRRAISTCRRISRSSPTLEAGI